jgi:type I restriction enzyme R subunit
MLEGARKKVRGLAGFVEKTRRTPIYTDFADTLGPETEIELACLTQDTFARFRQKTQAYLRQNLNHLAVHKLHTNQQLTLTDLEELQRMLSEAGVGAPEQLQEAAERSQGLGLFVRGLVGLDRQAASDVLSSFIAGKSLSANQLHFLDHIVDHLTRNGVLDVGRLYEALSPTAPRVRKRCGVMRRSTDWWRSSTRSKFGRWPEAVSLLPSEFPSDRAR